VSSVHHENCPPCKCNGWPALGEYVLQHVFHITEMKVVLIKMHDEEAQVRVGGGEIE